MKPKTSWIAPFDVNFIFQVSILLRIQRPFATFFRKHSSLLRTFFCDFYLQFIAPIKLWNKCIDLRLFSKYLRLPFLRPLRSKDDRCWILRLQPQNLAIISECLTANLEKVRQTSAWHMVIKFWFIWLWYLSFCITYKSKSTRNNKKFK